MTDDPRAQSDAKPGDVVTWLRTASVWDRCDVRGETLAAIADALEQKDAEIASRDEAFLKLAGENKNRRHANEKLERELTASRAENAALAKLVTAAIEYVDDLGNMGPHLEGDRKRVLKALRAGQQKGE